MLRSMRRRSRPEPLKPRREATWLVVRDRLSQVVESTPLEPLVDLRAVLTAAREARIAEGWECEDIGPCVALCVGFLPQCLAKRADGGSASAVPCLMFGHHRRHSHELHKCSACSGLYRSGGARGCAADTPFAGYFLTQRIESKRAEGGSDHPQHESVLGFEPASAAGNGQGQQRQDDEGLHRQAAL